MATADTASSLSGLRWSTAQNPGLARCPDLVG